jgi:hypothetical protein
MLTLLIKRRPGLLEHTVGMSLGGIVTSCYWFINKIKTLEELMYGEGKD